MLLEAGGHAVRIVYSGADALKAADDFKPEVVLCDIGLPGMDGREVASRLRARRDRPAVLVAVTGWGTEHDRVRTLAAGFDHHLVKPIDAASLDEIFDGLQAGSVAAPEAAVSAASPAAAPRR